MSKNRPEGKILNEAEFRRARRNAGLTQYEVSDLAGKDRSLASKIETGQRDDIMVSTLVAYARALGVSVERLLRKTPESDEQQQLVQGIMHSLEEMEPEELEEILAYIMFKREQNRKKS